MDEQKLNELKDALEHKIDGIKEDMDKKVDEVKASFEETYLGTGWGNYFFRGVVLFLLALTALILLFPLTRIELRVRSSKVKKKMEEKQND